MKVILSRKGFDSSFGGHPSIILPDGRYVSFPIPGDPDEICYQDIRQQVDGKTLYQAMQDLMQKVCYYDWQDFGPETNCHLDPDIVSEALERPTGWRGAFGQADAAQTVLEKMQIGHGDLFLFFGWFRHCTTEHRFSYTGDDLQCIYGYLQIEQVIHTAKDPLPKWLQYHPHALERRLPRKTNCIYVARETLSWDVNVPGYGMLRWNEWTQLTAPGLTRSKWLLPDCFRGKSMTYHSELSWKDGYFQSAHRGQEFVVEESPEIEEWARQVIENADRTTLFLG